MPSRDILDRHDQRFAFDEIEADVQIVWHTLFEVAVDIDFVDLLQAAQQSVAQAADTGVLQFHFLAGDAEGFAHADDLVCRQGAGAQAAFMTAAVHLSFQTHSRFATHI